MKNSLIKITRLGLLAVLLAIIPTVSHAQSTNAAVNTNATLAATPLPRPLPFRGSVAKLDTNAQTVTVGSLVLNVTPTTRIAKLNHIGSLSDIHVGDFVSGYYKKGPNAKLELFMIRTVPRAMLVHQKAGDPTAPGAPSVAAPAATPATNQ